MSDIVVEAVRRMRARNAAELADLKPHKMTCPRRGCSFVASGTMTILMCCAMSDHNDWHIMQYDPDFLRRVEP